LPASLDVLASERALAGVGDTALLSWLEVAGRTATVLHALSVGGSPVRVGPVRTVFTWPAGRLRDGTGSVAPCTVAGGGPAWLMAGDAAGTAIFRSDGGETWSFGPTSATSIERARTVCDHQGVTFAWEPNARGDTVNLVACAADACRSVRELPVRAPFDLARTGGVLYVADAGGVDGAMRVRSLVGSGPAVDVPLHGTLPRPRELRVRAWDGHVAAIAAESETYAFVSSAEPAVFLEPVGP